MIDYKMLLQIEFHVAAAKLHLHAGKPELAIREIQLMAVAAKNFELAALG